MTAAAQHCHDLVRDHAKDHYLASLFMADDMRPHALALYAFDAEIGRIARTVSEPQLGLIRQQWWLDTIDGIYQGEVPAHPVAEALANAISHASLPRHALRNLVTAREFDLYADAMPDVAALETYLGQTASALIQLVSLVLAGETAKASAEAAGFAGVAIGLSRLLYERPPRHLPPDMTTGHAMAHARQRLDEARQHIGGIPQSARAAFLPASLTESYLRGAKTTRPPSQFRRQLTMWWKARVNSF